MNLIIIVLVTATSTQFYQILYTSIQKSHHIICKQILHFIEYTLFIFFDSLK